MRVGEVLLEHGWVTWETLADALTSQRGSGVRLCSLLVARKQLDFDQASRALGQQLGVAAVLRKHLVHRDRSVARLLPDAFGRRFCAIPIGRLANGSLIVCARDPSPALAEVLARAVGEAVLIAVAPARYVERLVDHVYKPEIDVPIDVELDDAHQLSDFDLQLIEPEAEDDVLPVEIEAPDAPAPPPQRKSRPLPVQVRPITEPGVEPMRDSLDTTIASFPDIDDLEWLFDVVMGWVAKRWAASLILEVKERRATGVRGHGRRLKPSAVRALVVPLAEPSLVQVARDERRLVDEPVETSRSQASILTALDDAAHPLAAALVRHGDVAYVIAVGDPVTGEPSDGALDLEVLVEAINAALERI